MEMILGGLDKEVHVKGAKRIPKNPDHSTDRLIEIIGLAVQLPLQRVDYHPLKYVEFLCFYHPARSRFLLGQDAEVS